MHGNHNPEVDSEDARHRLPDTMPYGHPQDGDET